MTDATTEDDRYDDAMFMRVFELDGLPTVEAYVWPPYEDEDGKLKGTVSCCYQITGLGDEKFRSAYGVDGLQALTTALQFLGVHLYHSEEYKAGRLTFCRTPDLALPEMPGMRFGEYGHEMAGVVVQGHCSLVVMPQERFARVAFEAGWFERMAKAIKQCVKGDARRARRLGKSLQDTRNYYEAVCQQEGIPLPYTPRRARHLSARRRKDFRMPPLFGL